jgi:ribose 5-phosphate isomerase B
MHVHLATDHAGLEHKESVRFWLQSEGFAVVDHGALHVDLLDDFPDFISKAAQAVSRSKGSHRAVIFGGSGQGEAMMANRFPHVRAAVFYGGDPTIVTLSREHNDANVLSIGARFVSVALTKQVTWEWLHTEPLDDPKYRRRNDKLDRLGPTS